MDEPDTYGYNKSRTENSIADLGARANYIADFSKVFRTRAGVEYVRHDYLPEGLRNEFFSDGKGSTDGNDSPHAKANEYSAYTDNTLNFHDIVALNLGLRFSAYNIQSKTFTALEPRASVKVALGKDFSVKASYARMSQYVQQVSNNYINLPTDLWQPVIATFKPLPERPVFHRIIRQSSTQHVLFGGRMVQGYEESARIP